MAKKNTPPAARPKAQPVAKKAVAESTDSTRSQAWWPYALAVVAITFLLFSGSLKHGFVNWDDPDNVYENKNLDAFNAPKDLTIAHFKPIFDLKTGSIFGNYNPLPISTFAIEKAYFGFERKNGKIAEASQFRFHLDNVLLHLVAVFFVFRLLVLMGLSRMAAAFGALLFGIHPMRVESVSWVTERKDVLFGAFFFISLFLYARWIKRREAGQSALGIYATIIVLDVLGSFSKVQMVTLPLSMLALDFWFRRPMSWRWIWEKTPFWAISLAFGLVNVFGLAASKSLDDSILGYTFIDRIGVGAWSFFTYLYKLVLPYPLSPLYPYPKTMPIYAFFALIPVIGLAVWWFRSFFKNVNRAAVFGVFFFTANVIFLLQIKAAGQGYLADRFTYVAYFGFFALAAWLFDRFSEKTETSTLAFSLAGLSLVVFGFMNFQQQKIWKDGESLWTHVIKFEGKTSPTAWANRAQIFRDRGDFERGLADFNVVIDEITTHQPKLGDFNSRGKCYFDMATGAGGKYANRAPELLQKAMADYNRAVELVKDTSDHKSVGELYINRGAAYGATGNMAQAVVEISKGLAADPTNENGYLNRSLAYYNLHDFENALKDYSKYLELNPYYVEMYYERGLCEMQLKRTEAAEADFSKAISMEKEGIKKLEPATTALFYMERARARAALGRKAEAQADVAEAGKRGLKPDQDVLNRLAN